MSCRAIGNWDHEYKQAALIQIYTPQVQKHSYPKWEYKIKNVSVNWSMILWLELSPEFKMLCWEILGLALFELTLQNSPKMP